MIDRMGAPAVDSFARLFVLPQTGHGLTGSIYTTNGDGRPITSAPIPNTWDRVGTLIDWVESGKAPAKQITVTAGERTLPMCSYPTYPKYSSGAETAASSYICVAK